MRQAIVEKWPYIGLSVIFGIVAILGKGTALAVTTAGQKILMAFVTTWFTLASILTPMQLSALYPLSGEISLSTPRVLFSTVAVAFIMGAILWSVKKTKTFAFGGTWFIVTLAPAFINFAKGNEIYMGSDRYGYLPMIGILILAGSGLALILKKQFVRPQIVIGAVIAVIGVCGLLASAQASAWKNSETLFSTILQRYPESLGARNNLGMAYVQQNRKEDAMKEFNALLSMKEWPVTLVNRGLLKYRSGDVSGAVTDYLRAKELDPLLYDAYYELGNVAYRQGRLPEAIELFTKAHDLKPSYTNAVLNLGAAYLQSNDFSKAEPIFKELLSLNPLFTEAYYNLGIIYEQQQKWPEASAMYEQALSLNPSDQDAVEGLTRARSHQR